MEEEERALVPCVDDVAGKGWRPSIHTPTSKGSSRGHKTIEAVLLSQERLEVVAILVVASWSAPLSAPSPFAPPPSSSSLLGPPPSSLLSYHRWVIELVYSRLKP